MVKDTINYSILADDIIREVGGKENILSLRHCYTRLRFKLKDEKLAKKEALEDLEGVIGVFSNPEEYMVVIGNNVPKAYEAIVDKIDIKEELPLEENLDEKKGSIFSNILSLIMSSMQSIINLICAGGIIKGLITLLTMTHWLPDKSGVFVLLNAMGDAIFYFLPIALGYNFAKNLKGNPFLGMLIGAILCYPTINGVDLDFLGHTVNAKYTGSFLPVVFIVALAVPIEKWLNSKLPQVLKGFLTPAIVLLITLPIGYLIIGPIANIIGGGINSVFTNLIAFNPVIAGLFIGAFWQVLVIFGLHGVPSTFIFMNLAAGNSDQFLAMNILISFAATGVALAVYLKTKSTNLKSVTLPAVISGFFGITEPIIYGVTLSRMKMFIISCIAAAIGCATTGLLNVTAYSFSGIGFFAILGMLNPKDPQILPILLIILVHFVTGFVLAYIFYKDDQKELI